MIQPGVSEYDIGLEIEFFFRRSGAEVGFAPIVASGPNSARPHAHPTERKLAVGDFVTLDIGCKLDGYNSDMTRTFVVGEASDRHREIYDLVLKAEVECIEMLKPGANGRDVDGRAREILDEKDLAKYFGHSLGHGLGRAVHDYGRLHISADQPIEVGQVWTVEPGVYIEGFGGVRIEDDVLVTENGPKILTHYPKDLRILP
jgi:Xaa-Pro aminopeptidase